MTTPARPPPINHAVEFARSTEAGDPFAFRFVEQTYVLRQDDGSFESSAFPWSDAILDDLAAIERAKPDRVAAQRIGDTMRAFLDRAAWKSYEPRIREAAKAGQRIQITIRSAAAELYALPWELLTMKSTGEHLGEVPNLLLKYEWPGILPAPRAAEPEPEGGRILFAWSAAGGAVPAEAHLEALASACKNGHLPFDTTEDVVPNASLASLKKALSSGGPVAVLHLLAHGGAAESDTESYGILFNSRDGAGADVIDAGSLRQTLAPFAGSLRLVVLCACHGGAAGALGNHLGSVAQALHRAGIPAVIASRYPFSVEGSVTLTKALYNSLLVDLAPLEEAVLAARSKLAERPEHLDWASIQIYCHEEGYRDHRPFEIRPYRGLSPFQASDRRFYFGREADIARLVSVLQRGRRLLTLVGASGSGKSSLVLAGLVPAVEKGALGEGTWWIRIMHPGTQPGATLRGVARSLVPTDQDGAPMSKHIAASLIVPSSKGAVDDSFVSSALMSLNAAPGSPRLLLVVDQFEEVFTQGGDRASINRFIEQLLDATEHPSGRIVVVLTLRADFMDQSLENRRLAVRIRESMDIALPMSIPMIREAIVRPAELVGLRFEDGLVEALIDALREVDLASTSVGGPEGTLSPGSLPLLQFALEALWEHRKEGLISWSAWRDIKGVRGAIARRADEVIAELPSPEEQTMVRDVFSRLIRLGDGTADTRRYASREELESMFPGRAGEILDRLIAARLLTVNEAEIGIAHESLIREWGALRRWLSEGREALRARQDIDTDAQRWEAGGRSDDDLWRGGRLDRAIELNAAYRLPLSPLEKAFLSASEAAKAKDERAAEEQRARELEAARRLAESQRKAARRARLGMVLMAGVLAASIAAFYSSILARKAEEEAARKTVLAEQEAAKAKEASKKADDATRVAAAREMLASDPTRAALILREVGRIEETAGWIDSAAELLWKPMSLQIYRHRAAVTAASYSPDGHRVLTGSRDKTARIWREDGPPITFEHDAPVLGAEWSPDGRRILTVCEGGALRVFAVEEPSRAPLVLQREVEIVKPSWSPRGDRIVAVAHDNTARVFRANGQGSPAILKHATAVSGAVFSPDGESVLTGSTDGIARIWTADGSKPPRELRGHEGPITSVSFDREGKRVLTASMDKTARVFRADGTGKPITLKGHEEGVLFAAFSPEGKRVATTSEDKVVRVFASDGSGTPRQLIGHEGWPFHALWTADGMRLVTISDGETPRLWSVDGDEAPLPLRGHAGATVSVALSPDGKSVLTAANDSTARAWGFGRRGAAELIKYTAPVLSASFSPNGERVLAVLGDGTARLWWKDIGEKIVFRQKEPVRTASFGPDGKKVLTTSDGNDARIWPDDGGAPIVLKGHDKRVGAASFSRDGARVLTVSLDKTARVWPVSGGAPVVLRHPEAVIAAAFRPDGQAVATAAADRKVRVWQLSGGAPVELVHDDDVVSVSFSLSGEEVLTICKEGGARIWRADGSGAPLLLKGSDRQLLSASFGPRGKHILAMGADNTVRVWDDRTSSTPTLLVGTSAVFSPDEAFVLTTPRNATTTARLWFLDKPREPIVLRGHDKTVRTVAFSPDGRRALTASDDHTARIWPLTADLMLEALDDATDACLSAEDRRVMLGETPATAEVAEKQCYETAAPKAAETAIPRAAPVPAGSGAP